MTVIIYREYYMGARRYEISLRVFIMCESHVEENKNITWAQVLLTGWLAYLSPFSLMTLRWLEGG